MFGRKTFGRKPVAAPPAPPPSQAAASPDYREENVDAALGILSDALGMDLDFDMAYIFSPALWGDPMIADLLEAVPLKAEMAGNKVALLKSPQTVARLAAMSETDPVRLSLAEAGFGTKLYNPNASNRFDDGMTAMQMNELRKICASPASAEAKRYATLNLMMFCEDVLKGKVKLG